VEPPNNRTLPVEAVSRERGEGKVWMWEEEGGRGKKKRIQCTRGDGTAGNAL